MSSEEISKLATIIEPTDSIYMNENCIFNPLNGEVVKTLGSVDGINILVLEPNEKLNTAAIRSRKDYKNIKIKNKQIINVAFEKLEKGFKNSDFKLIGQAATISSLANENIHKKEYLNEILTISKNYGAYGLNVAHSGTVIGIILDNEMDSLKLKQKIIDKNIHRKYNKIYPVRIINGGVRGER